MFAAVAGVKRAILVLALVSGLASVAVYVHTRQNSTVAAGASVGPNHVPIPATYFGLTVLNFSQVVPSMPFGTSRSWDAGPGLAWAEANPSRGVYDFAALDRFITYNKVRGAEPIYTFGRTPLWASAQPENTSSPYGRGQCAPPANLKDWDDYVAAVATHAAGAIKYWELWNEPNDPGYCGDVTTLVAMAQHAARILRKIDPSALILSPSADKASGPAWLGSFLSEGGAGSVDVIAFHGYWSAEAEDIVPVAARFRAVAAAHGLSALPLWDTESSWAYTSTMPLPPADDQVAYLAKSFLLHWSAGVQRFAWYAYDGGSPWGTLYTRNGGESAAAQAYTQTFRWMVGATMTSACSEAKHHVWTCKLLRPGGYEAEAVWMTHGSAKFAVPQPFTEFLDLAGNAKPVRGGSVMIGDEPILLQKRPLP